MTNEPKSKPIRRRSKGRPTKTLRAQQPEGPTAEPASGGVNEHSCRRCHQCSGLSHHWMHDFDDGDWEHSPEPRPVWGCKHCEFTMPMDPDDIEGERVEELYADFMSRQRTTEETTAATESKPKPAALRLSPRAYSLKGQLSQLVEAANDDHDRASWIELGESSDNLEGAIVILKGHDTVRDFERWATKEGHFTPGNLQSFTSKALDYRLPDLDGKSAYYLSPPMVCPCTDRSCKEVGREIGCKEHPAAGVRAVVFVERIAMFCNECGRTIATLPTPRFNERANRAAIPNNIN